MTELPWTSARGEALCALLSEWGLFFESACFCFTSRVSIYLACAPGGRYGQASEGDGLHLYLIGVWAKGPVFCAEREALGPQETDLEVDALTGHILRVLHEEIVFYMQK